MAPITATYTALLLGLVTVLALNTSRLRVRSRRAPERVTKEAIGRASRAHGNTLEHTLPLLLLLFFCESYGVAASLLCSIGAAFLVARLLYVYGMLTRPASPPMFAGATVTYALELLLVGLLARALACGA